VANNKQQGTVYLLWPLGSSFCKIGFTKYQTADKRALQVQTACPFPIGIVAEMQGSVSDEKVLHAQLQNWRASGEWFSLPEPICWWLFQRFGLKIPEGVEVASC